MEKIIKVRLFTWFEETPNLVHPGGDPVLTERIAHHGEKVDITNDVSLNRGEELGAFYTDEEAAQIEDGSYRGPDAGILFNRRAGIRPAATVENVDGEGPQVQSLDSAQLADYIRENKLTVSQTVALADDSTEGIEKVLDAENIATDNEPRKGVTDALETKLQVAAEAGK
jgi:hypothetical protein